MLIDAGNNDQGESVVAYLLSRCNRISYTSVAFS